MLLREAGFVNLWFFLKVIAGATGPFEKLNTDLHLEMCNFRQSLLAPGSRGAAALSRGFYKSSIFTSGGNAWEMLRWPDVKICIFNAIVDKAAEFLHITQRVFDNNALFRALYPKWAMKRSISKKWNEKEGTLGNRTRDFTEPTIRIGSVGGAAEGGHFDVFNGDDLVGLAQLNANRESSADMYKITNWFKSSKRTLLQTISSSRIILVFTRYAVDDCYEQVMKSIKEFIGYQEVLEVGGYKEEPDKGEWRVYYRCAKEYEKAICPEIIDLPELNRMAEEDPWTYLTQMQNMPHASEHVEFAQMSPGECWLDVKTHEGGETEWFVVRESVQGEPEGHVKIPLVSLDVTGGVDPAATETYISAKTSKTAVALWGQDHQQNKYLLDLKVGYVTVSKMFDWIFDMSIKFKDLIKLWAFESTGYQRVLQQRAEEEKRRRSCWVYFKPIPAVGDKVARIRGSLGPELERGRIYVNREIGTEFLMELKIFPGNKYRMDTLDASVHALKESSTPFSEEELREIAVEDREYAHASSDNVTGY